MITRVHVPGKSRVQFRAFFTGVVAPTFTVQNMNIGSTRYQKFLDVTSNTWSTAPVQNMMNANLGNPNLYESALYDQSVISEGAIDEYMVVISSNGAVNILEAELWKFGSTEEGQLKSIFNFLLAPRTELSRPDSFTVQHSLFDAKTGGNEIMRFTTIQNTSGTQPEEVRTNNTDLIGAAS